MVRFAAVTHGRIITLALIALVASSCGKQREFENPFDPANAGSDFDGDGVVNGVDLFPVDRACTTQDDDNCAACGKPCPMRSHCEAGICLDGCARDLNCELGEICLATICTPGCVLDSGCPPSLPFCLLGQCVECRSSADCTAELPFCARQECGPDCGSPPIDNDVENCGSCRHRCADEYPGAAGLSCVAGQCSWDGTCQPGWAPASAPEQHCAPVCGDRMRLGPEECDDGNLVDADGCSSSCAVEMDWVCGDTSPSICARCGDGIIQGGELCDDGNLENADGCSSTCTIEPGWICDRANAHEDAGGRDNGTRDMGASGSNTADGSILAEAGGGPDGGENLASVCLPICGDGQRRGSESCDDGNMTTADGCSDVCALEPGWTCNTLAPNVCTTHCGDGLRTGVEACDDGNATTGDGCGASCQVEAGTACSGGSPSSRDVCTAIRCGDGIRAVAETCDDGNMTSEDGCSATCRAEPGWHCDAGIPNVCATRCGDGMRAGLEACDDGNATTGDGCGASCQVEAGTACSGGSPSSRDVCTAIRCGDGIRAVAETCDDGNTNMGDGCATGCTIEPGWVCNVQATPSMCSTNCGDGLLVGNEGCDDGNGVNDDGCSSCVVEFGWTCDANSPSICETICGDSVVVGPETCDDGNSVSGDGCSSSCILEPSWSICRYNPATGGCPNINPTSPGQFTYSGTFSGANNFSGTCGGGGPEDTFEIRVVTHWQCTISVTPSAVVYIYRLQPPPLPIFGPELACGASISLDMPSPFSSYVLRADRNCCSGAYTLSISCTNLP